MESEELLEEKNDDRLDAAGNGAEETAGTEAPEASQEESGGEISFADLGLDEKTLAAVARKGFVTPSPIQTLAIPRLLNGDANVIARARTGTGKTAAFGLPLVQKLREKSGCVRALVLEPTRELAMQTCAEMQSFTDGACPRTCVLYGGASYSTQLRELRRGCEIVVGTPGRVQDHIERRTLDLSKIDYFILDEGDEMLDMGFIDDIEAIFESANPDSRILLFSATMPEPILKIAGKFMGEYEIVEEEGVIDEPLLIEQNYWVVRESEKINALVRLIDISDDFYGLVFTQTKMDADQVSKALDERGYEVAALHGDIAQNQREKILARFRIKKTRILVATDVAARGIDITGLSHVVNYSLPFDGATYVHRIGRTGRAGSAGTAITFVRPEEVRKLGFLQRAVRRASKGEMTEGEVPSVDDVLARKRERLFLNLKKKLGLDRRAEEAGENAALAEDDSGGAVSEQTDGADAAASETAAAVTEEAAQENGAAENAARETGAAETAGAENADGAQADGGDADMENAARNAVSEQTDGADAAASETAAAVTEEAALENGAAENAAPEESGGASDLSSAGRTAVSSLRKVPAVFEEMAEELCEEEEPEAVLAAVLSVMYSGELDRARYGKIQDGRGKAPRGGGERDDDQTRIYVQLGRRDGYDPRGIADYFSDLLHIPGRMVDRIDVSVNFSLVSLPSNAARRALDLSQTDRGVPHMHVDTASGGGSGGKFGGRPRGGGGFRSSRRRDGGGFRSDSRDYDARPYRSDSRDYDARPYRSKGQRPNFHTPTERSGNAGFYRRKSGRAERF